MFEKQKESSNQGEEMKTIRYCIAALLAQLAGAICPDSGAFRWIEMGRCNIPKDRVFPHYTEVLNHAK